MTWRYSHSNAVMRTHRNYWAASLTEAPRGASERWRAAAALAETVGIGALFPCQRRWHQPAATHISPPPRPGTPQFFLCRMHGEAAFVGP